MEMDFVCPRKTLRALRNSFNMCPCIPDRIEIWHGWFLRIGGKPEYPEKNLSAEKRLSEQGENQQQTQGARSGTGTVGQCAALVQEVASSIPGSHILVSTSFLSV